MKNLLSKDTENIEQLLVELIEINFIEKYNLFGIFIWNFTLEIVRVTKSSHFTLNSSQLHVYEV